MQLKHLQTIREVQEGSAKVTAVAWSPNNIKLAVVTVDRVVSLFNEDGEKQDKFSTKPATSDGPKTYLVKALAWSPDSTKLAVAQTDNIVFVYKLGSPEKAHLWEKKKSICNKFLQTSPVTCMTWPSVHANTIVYGLVEGKVRLGHLKNNKSNSLYATGSMCVAIDCSPDGQNVVSAHVDGKIYRCAIASGARQSLLCQHPCPAYALTWAESIAAAGSDKRMVFYNDSGRVVQQFDHSKEENETEAAVAIKSPSAQAVVVGSFNRLRVYDYNMRRSTWTQSNPKDIQNLYSVTSMCWKPDGSRLIVGNLCGGVESFDCCLKKVVYKGKFDFTYVGPSQVIVKKIATGTRLVLRSQHGYELEKINVLGNDQFIVANTPETLLVGDLLTCRLSEVPWRLSGSEKYYFDNPNCCLVFNAGELSVIEYGINEVLGSVRTEHMNPHVFSICAGGGRLAEDAQKKIAYLIDAKTISVMELGTSSTVATIEHDSKVDWLEMNETGRKLLFRDKRRRLVLFDFATEISTPLLSFCSYVQWVPGSDVVVAQNRKNLCVWYSIDHPERVTSFEIKGDVEDIERVDGKTEVVVDEGMEQVTYTLDEGLIEFGTAVEDADYFRAVHFLETLDDSSEAKAMWTTLASLALEAEELIVAERCYAALGNVAKARYLHKINEASREEGSSSYKVQAGMAALNQHFKLAETLYLEHSQPDKAIEMYEGLHQWDNAIAVAAARNLPNLEEMKAQYMTWLIETGQEEKAGDVKEREGDFHAALTYYMKSGVPGRAAALVMRHPELGQSQEIIDSVASALLDASLYQTAGELFEKAKLDSRALEAYKKGHVYSHAVDLCRNKFPNDVTALEEQWGDYLSRQKQTDAAIPHYIEAGRMEKAIEAAIHARQWAKAAQIVDMQDDAVAKPYFKLLAEHYGDVRDLKMAEKYFLKANNPRGAIDLYVKCGKWEQAHKLSARHLPKEDVSDMYIAKAEELEQQHKYKEAEKLYLSVNEPDYAINMYKKINQYDDMVRLISAHHPDLLEQTHKHLAGELEADGHLAQAETHYINAEDWRGAVNMYRGRDLWDDAFRVAKSHGGAIAAQQVAYMWAKSLGGDSAVKLLVKLNMVSSAVDIACEQNAFDFAFELSRTAAKDRLSDVHLKHAMYLEDEGLYQQAEDEFVKAGRPKEAVLMYVHTQDWDSAQRIAEAHDPDSVSDVLVGQARVAFQSKEYSRAETFLLRAQRPELAVRYYKEAGMWDDAIRLAREYVPGKVAEVQAAMKDAGITVGDSAEDMFTQAQRYEADGKYEMAIDTYMRITEARTQDRDLVQESCEKAAEVAGKFAPGRAAQVATNAARVLVQLQLHETAAHLLANIDMVREAVAVCLDGDLYDLAKQIAEDADDAELVEEIEEQQKSHLMQAGDARGVSKLDSVAALDLYVQQGDWQQCMREAEEQGGQVLQKYSALYAVHLLKQQLCEQALAVFTKYGAPSSQSNFNIYRALARQVFADATDFSYRVYAELRDVLQGVTSGIRPGSGEYEEFDTMTRIAHYFALRKVAGDLPDLETFKVDISLSLLRYCDSLIPADRAFFEAGMACREAGDSNSALVLFDRYVDLVDCIENESEINFDNTDFMGTDIPFDVELPADLFVDAETSKEVSDWTLVAVMEDDNERVLRKDSRGIFVASLVGPDGTKSEPCVVNGLPILGDSIPFEDEKVASREAWNKLVMCAKQTHNEHLQDVLRFLQTWCGAHAQYAF
eukprot:m.198132 g.198132  ORF g.198132 m.198132 type:complete len:1733 (+) comp14914_c0_seq4:203-5401(+)